MLNELLFIFYAMVVGGVTANRGTYLQAMFWPYFAGKLLATSLKIDDSLVGDQ